MGSFAGRSRRQIAFSIAQSPQAQRMADATRFAAIVLPVSRSHKKEAAYTQPSPSRENNLQMECGLWMRAVMRWSSCAMFKLFRCLRPAEWLRAVWRWRNTAYFAALLMVFLLRSLRAEAVLRWKFPALSLCSGGRECLRVDRSEPKIPALQGDHTRYKRERRARVEGQ